MCIGYIEISRGIEQMSVMNILVNKDKNNESEYWGKLRSKLDSGDEIKVCDDFGHCYVIGTYKGYKYLYEYREDTYASYIDIRNIYINMPKNEESTYKLYGHRTTNYLCYSLNMSSPVAGVTLKKLGLLRDGYEWFNIHEFGCVRLICEQMLKNISHNTYKSLRGLYNTYNSNGIIPEIEYCKGVIDTFTGEVRKAIVSNKGEYHVVYDNTLYRFKGNLSDESLNKYIRTILPFIEIVRDLTDLEVMIGAVQLDDGTVIAL